MTDSGDANLDDVRRLGDVDVEAFLGDPQRRQAFVTPMFNRIAARYDDFTRLFSFGMDAGWKRDVVRAACAEAPDAQAALDLACGTGDLAVAIAASLPAVRVIGIDASPRMVAEARSRLRPGTPRDDETGVTSREVATASSSRALASRVHVALGDMMSLGIRDATVDVITSGYGVRNVPSARTAVQEMARVLRPGGVLVTLDFYRPEPTLWRVMFLRYLAVAGNVVGWWWHRDPIVYGYIARSVEHFMSWRAFSALLVEEGFAVRRVTRHLGGAIAMHVAVRSAR